MKKSRPQLQIARPEDAQAWVRLAFPSVDTISPEMMNAEVGSFNAPPPDIDESRFIAWLDDKPIARASFQQLENVVELRDFTIEKDYITEYGTPILQSIAEEAARRGNVLTVDFYPPVYSRSFRGAEFKENVRTRMMKSLIDYTAQSVDVPDGITLRNPNSSDEAAVAEMIYHNYVGTADQEMVSSSRAQATSIIRAMFHNDYNLLDPGGSYLAVDAAGKLVGDVILGDAGRDPGEHIAWIMDVSVAPSHRGEGLGKALLVSAINASKRRAFPRIGLIVTIGNDTAHSLYRSLGFEDYGEVMHEAVLKL
jgi:ribosomal protein S18 acetylase RimI-like enzyme